MQPEAAPIAAAFSPVPTQKCDPSASASQRNGIDQPLSQQCGGASSIYFGEAETGEEESFGIRHLSSLEDSVQGSADVGNAASIFTFAFAFPEILETLIGLFVTAGFGLLDTGHSFVSLAWMITTSGANAWLSKA